MYYLDDGSEYEFENFPKPIKLRPGLFIGPSETNQFKEVLQSESITHILDLTGKAAAFPKEFKYLIQQNISDSVDQDILCIFPECMTFIQNGLQAGGGVLITCQAGNSRSITVAAAYLMFAELLTMEEALMDIQKVRPSARPNYGFLLQLKMWREMEFTLVGSGKSHRLYRLQNVARRLLHSGELLPLEYAEDPEMETKDLIENAGCNEIHCGLDFVGQKENSNSSSIGLDTSMVFCCSNCGRKLFRDANIMEHVCGQEGRLSKCLLFRSPDIFKCCDAFFIEPVRWMITNDLQFVEGKLSCPNVDCNQTLGSWSWKLTECSCMSSVFPSFRIFKKKVFSMVLPTGQCRQHLRSQQMHPPIPSIYLCSYSASMDSIPSEENDHRSCATKALCES